MDTDNKNILLYRKIILLCLGLMTCLRWSTVEIEKAITKILKTYELKGFFKVCGAKESHECLLGIVSAKNIAYELKGFFKACTAKESHECLLGMVSAQKCYQTMG